MTSTRRRIASALAVLATVPAFAATGGSPADAAVAGNAADRAFTRQVLALSELQLANAAGALRRAEHEETRVMAQMLVADASDRLAGVASIARSVYVDPAAGTLPATVNGPWRSYDHRFTSTLIPLHEQLLASARRELAHGADERLRDIAGDVIAETTAQTATLVRWRADWYGAAAAL